MFVMRGLLFTVGILSFIFIRCGNTDKTTAKKEEAPILANATAVNASGDVDFEIYDYEGLAPLLNAEDDKIYIVNFWATWCKPCIEELPYFERIYAEQKNNNVELILVSLDMPSMWEKRLVPFVAKNNLQGKVVILNDPKMNEWIPKVDKDWQGGIPATLIYNSNQRFFYEGGFTYEELNQELNKFLNL